MREGDLDDVQSAGEQGLGQRDGVVGILNDGDTDEERGLRILAFIDCAWKHTRAGGGGK